MNRGGPLRTCGKRYATEADAWCSKRGLVDGACVVPCRGCKGWHVISPKVGQQQAAAKDPQPYRGFPEPVRQLVLARDANACLHCGDDHLLEVHHRRIKGMGGDSRDHTDCPCNAATVCRGDHRWAHLSRHQALAKGFTIPRGTVLPGAISVMLHSAGGGGTSMFPTCSGEWTSAAPEGVAA